MSLRRYAPDIYGWSRLQPERGYEFNGTALVGSDGTVLIVDPISAEPAELQAIRQLGRRFVIVLLNCDHERDAARFSKELDAPIRISALDAPSLKQPGAIPFQSGEALPGGWVVHTLGAMKTAGESVLHHAASRTLVVGDAVIADPFTGIRLVPHAKLPDRAGAVASLAGIAQLDFDALFTGDGFVLPSGGRDALRKFLQKEGQ